MNLHSSSADLTLHRPVRLTPDACPSCGQELPADRLEELTGRIAARERDQAQALTNRLNDQFRAQKEAAEAQATAALEQERRASATREAKAVQAANEAATAQLAQRLAAVRQQAATAQEALQAQLDASTAAKAQADQQLQHLSTALAEAQRTGQEQVRQAKAEATAREAQLRESLGAEVERTVVQRLATAQVEHQAAQRALEEQLTQARAAKQRADEQHAALQAQLTALASAKDAEISTIKTNAAEEAARARREAAEQTAATYANQLKEKDDALQAATTSAQEANQQLLALAAAHEQTIAEQLSSQREILEKAKEDAVNAEKARAFDENQKLATKVNQLQRDLEKKTNEELGEGAEIDLYESLRAEFPEDRITRIPKGAAGADVRHEIMHAGKVCGLIIYDSKNHKQWRTDHASKLRSDQVAAQADHAILSLQQFPQGVKQLAIREGVLLANPARVVALASMLRKHVIQLSTMRASNIERETKTAKLYDFITSERFLQLTSRVEQKTATLQKEQEKEIRFHNQHWKTQGECFQAILKAKADLDHELNTIIGAVDEATDEVTDKPADDDFFSEFLR